MKKQMTIFVAAFALIAGCVGVAQVFTLVSVSAINNAKLDELPGLASEYSVTASSLASTASAPQVTQVNSELNSRLQLIQIRQNAEIIRLLGVIAAKK